MKKLLYFTIVAVLVSAILPMAVAAQGPVTCADEVTVQRDDSLSKIADKYFGNVNSWPAIMAWHNQAVQADPDKFPNKIENADVLGVGWTICIPSEEDAQAFLEIYDPSKPELLFAGGEKGKLVVGSWWTAGGEAEGLTALFEIYEMQNPGVEIINAATAGGAGTNFKGALKTRLLGGEPPDSFQLHVGLEVESYSPDKYMRPVDDIFVSEDLEAVLPADLLGLLKYQDHFWGVPVNNHRNNILWYNKSMFEENGLTPPVSIEEFQTVAEALDAKGIVPLSCGTKEGWEVANTFENILAGTVGPETYKGLFTGQVAWTDPGVAQALENTLMIMSYCNPDHAAMTWDEGAQYFLDGEAGMIVMGDWVNGWLKSKGFTDFGWVASPGSDGVYVFLSDSFAIPEKAPDMDNAIAWLKTCASKEGQEAFNPLKGAICARTDCDPAFFDSYGQWLMDEWSKDAIVASAVHGAAIYESWLVEFKDILALFMTSQDVEGTQTALQQACADAGICQ